MSTVPGSAHLPALSHHEQAAIGGLLQATLVDLVDLTLLGKQLHWSVVGPHFRPLHLQLDECVERWRELADTVAERAVAIGCWPDGQASTVAATSQGVALDAGAVQDQALVYRLTHRLAEIGERNRERMNRLGELDPASEDVLIEVVRELETQLWMFRAQLTSGRADA